jgi:oxygen-independent coproporphyrinogen-3 oxidase
MSNSGNHNSGTVAPKAFGVPSAESRGNAGDTPATTRPIRHIYVHIPFCARICPYRILQGSSRSFQTGRFCEAILRELELHQGTGDSPFLLLPSTIYFGGGTPTALTIAQLELLLRGFRERLDLSRLEEWTIEAIPAAFPPEKPTF